MFLSQSAPAAVAVALAHAHIRILRKQVNLEARSSWRSKHSPPFFYEEAQGCIAAPCTACVVMTSCYCHVILHHVLLERSNHSPDTL